MGARVAEHLRCASSGPRTCPHRLSVLHQTWEVSYHFCSEEEGLQAQGVGATSPKSPANEDGGRAANCYALLPPSQASSYLMHCLLVPVLPGSGATWPEPPVASHTPQRPPWKGKTVLRLAYGSTHKTPFLLPHTNKVLWALAAQLCHPGTPPSPGASRDPGPGHPAPAGFGSV